MENDSFSGLGLLERPPWSALPLEAMKPEVSVASVAGPCCCWKQCCCPWSVLLTKIMVCLTSRGQMDVCGLGCCLRPGCYLCHLSPCRCPWSARLLEARWTSLVCATPGGYADVCGPCCFCRPFSCTQPELPPRAMKMSLLQAVTEGCIDVYDLRCCWRPCRGQWTVLSPEAMWESMLPLYMTRKLLLQWC